MNPLVSAQSFRFAGCADEVLVGNAQKFRPAIRRALHQQCEHFVENRWLLATNDMDRRFASQQRAGAFGLGVDDPRAGMKR